LVREVAHQLRPLACVAAVAKHDTQTRADAEDFPQRVGDPVVNGAVLELEDTDGKAPPPVAGDVEGHGIER
jgi:hypothetical protein